MARRGKLSGRALVTAYQLGRKASAF